MEQLQSVQRPPMQSVLSPQQKTELERLAAEHNARVNNGRNPQQNLGKDDFLKLLLTQLAHQDPTAPLEDKEFIAQMAQFTSLEQMKNISADFAQMTRMMSTTEAASALGKNVEIRLSDDAITTGEVTAVSREAVPRVLVNGVYYEWDSVTKVLK